VADAFLQAVRMAWPGLPIRTWKSVEKTKEKRCLSRSGLMEGCSGRGHLRGKMGKKGNGGVRGVDFVALTSHDWP